MPTQHIPTLLQLSIYTLYICIVARSDAGTIIMSNRIALPQERIHLAYAHCCIIAILVYTRTNHNKTAVICRVNTLLIAHARFGGWGEHAHRPTREHRLDDRVYFPVPLI